MNSLLKETVMLQSDDHINQNFGVILRLDFKDATYYATRLRSKDTKKDVIDALLNLAALIEESI